MELYSCEFGVLAGWNGDYQQWKIGIGNGRTLDRQDDLPASIKIFYYEWPRRTNDQPDCIITWGVQSWHEQQYDVSTKHWTYANHRSYNRPARIVNVEREWWIHGNFIKASREIHQIVNATGLHKLPISDQ